MNPELEQPIPLDLAAIHRELEAAEGEIDARIAEIEAGQIVTHATMRLEFGV